MSALAPFVGHARGLQARDRARRVPASRCSTYASFRLMGFRFPAPCWARRPAAVFLFLEETRSGAGPSRARSPGSSPTPTASASRCCSSASSTARIPAARARSVPALLLASSAFAHGYAVLWAGLVRHLLPLRRRAGPGGRSAAWRRWPALAFALAGVLLLPLLADWGWTTPYDDPWITVTTQGLVPPLLWPLFGAGRSLGLVGTLALARRRGGPTTACCSSATPRSWAPPSPRPAPPSGSSTCASCPSPSSRCACSAGPTLGLAPRARPRPRPRGPGPRPPRHALRRRPLAGAALTGSTGTTPASRPRSCGRPSASMTDALAGAVGDPRVAVEYSAEHERAGSIRMYETLPFFSGPLHPRGRLQPGQPPDPSRLLPGLGAGRHLAEPVPGDRLLALRPRRRARPPAPLRRERHGRPDAAAR